MNTGSVGFTSVLYVVFAVICVLLLMVRRNVNFIGSGELGGPSGAKICTCVFLCLLWLVYIMLSALHTYGVIQVPF